jgi:hypothetical protein
MCAGRAERQTVESKRAAGIPSRHAPYTVSDAIDYSTNAHECIWSTLQHSDFPSSPRLNLVYAYLVIALEHHHAIWNLVGLKLHGSAFALFRPQLETGFRGLWVNLCAAEEQINAIAQKGEEPFPRRFRDMADDLERAYDSGGRLASFANHWSALNGYTHSGLEQLGRRFGEDGNLQPAYTEAMLIELLVSSATLSIGLFVPIFNGLGFKEKAKTLNDWLANQPIRSAIE